MYTFVFLLRGSKLKCFRNPLSATFWCNILGVTLHDVHVIPLEKEKQQQLASKANLQKLWLNLSGLVIILQKTFLMSNQPFIKH